MNFLNSYLVVSPPSTRPQYFKRTPNSISRHPQSLNSQYRKRTSSSNDMYSPKQTTTHSWYTAQQFRSQKKRDPSPSFPKNNKDIQIESSNNLHIERTIDSVNQYAQQLKITLINQYKYQKMQSIRRKRVKQAGEGVTAPTEVSNAEDEEGKAKPKEIVRHPTYKTLNMMYQAIIDNSFQQTRKDGWELQAVKLPIVNRQQNQIHTIDLEEQLIGNTDPLSRRNHSNPSRKDLCYFTSTFSASKRTPKFVIKKQRGRKNVSQDNIEIIPWATFQQNQWD